MKKTIDYEILITEKDFSVNYTNTVEASLAALMIARDNICYVQGNLKKSLDQAKGKDLLKIKDRLSKFTTALIAVDLIINSTLPTYKGIYDKEVGSVPSDNGNTEPGSVEEGAEKAEA